MYAKAFLKRLDADAITISPYMGSDSVKPFLEYKDKWAIVLGLTSNEGSADFQQQQLNGKELYLHVIETSSKWGNENNMMFVVGATKVQMLSNIRKIVPNHFLLVPGIGAQGGSLQEVCKYGLTKEIGLLVNSSRAIIYASNELDFAEKAANEAKKIAEEMSNQQIADDLNISLRTVETHRRNIMQKLNVKNAVSQDYFFSNENILRFLINLYSKIS